MTAWSDSSFTTQKEIVSWPHFWPDKVFMVRHHRCVTFCCGAGVHHELNVCCVGKLLHVAPLWDSCYYINHIAMLTSSSQPPLAMQAWVTEMATGSLLWLIPNGVRTWLDYIRCKLDSWILVSHLVLAKHETRWDIKVTHVSLWESFCHTNCFAQSNLISNTNGSYRACMIHSLGRVAWVTIKGLPGFVLSQHWQTQ